MFQDKSKDCDTLILEKSRLQAICDQKQSEIEQLRKEAGSLSDQANYMRKDVCILITYFNETNFSIIITNDSEAIPRQIPK